MRMITEVLDKTFTPLRPKVFEIITPEDLYDDHVALNNKIDDITTEFQRRASEHDTIEANLSSLSDRHTTILTKTGSLSKIHGALRDQIDIFDGRIPGILEDTRRRIKEHGRFSKRISELSKRTDTIESKLDYVSKDSMFSNRISKLSERTDIIESKLDYVKNCLKKHETPCSVIRRHTRVIRVYAAYLHPARYRHGTIKIWMRAANEFYVEYFSCKNNREVLHRSIGIPVWHHGLTTWGRHSAKTATCICASAVDKGVKYAIKRSTSLVGVGSIKHTSDVDWKHRGSPGLGIRVCDLESTIPRNFRSASEVNDAKVYINDTQRGTGSGDHKVLPNKTSTLMIKHPDYYPVTKRFKLNKITFAYIVVWLVKRR